MTIQEDVKMVMGNLIAIAQLTLKQKGTVTPFAVAVTTDGEVQQLSSDEGIEPDQAIERLTVQCVEKAAAGTYRATGIAYDVRRDHPDTGEERDAIAVNFDHRDNASVIYCLPYRIKGGELEMEQPLTQQGAGRVFGANGSTGAG